MATISFYLDMRSQKKDGTYPIKLNVWHNGQFLISTGFSATPDTWNGSEYSKAADNYKTKNVAIRNMINKAETYILMLEMDRSLESMSDKVLKKKIEEEIKGNKTKKQIKNFIYYLDQFIEMKSNKGTKELYIGTRNKLLSYDMNCTFESMNKLWLIKFENWMAKTMKINAYAIHLRNIRAVFNYALDEEITTLYPFRKFKIKKEETRKRSLTIEELCMLRDYPCEEYQKRYRDIFMLMFYLIGINAVDLFNAKKITNGRLEYKRAKTGKLYSIKVEPEAMEILNRYRGRDYLLNVMDEYSNYKDFLHRMGTALKQIGECKREGLGGKKNITPLFPDLSSYWSRHSWATIASSLDIPKETISAALGHEMGNKVTAIYIDFDRKKIDNANRIIIDSLK